AFIFALVGIVIVFVAGLLLGRSPAQMTLYFGGGFWSLIPFTMQMALIVIFGYVVASSPPVYRLVQWLATIPKGPRTAVAWIALSVLVASRTAPDGRTARTAERYGVRPEPLEIRTPARQRPGEWLEYSPLLTILIVLVGIAYLVQLFRSKGGLVAGIAQALDL